MRLNRIVQKKLPQGTFKSYSVCFIYMWCYK